MKRMTSENDSVAHALLRAAPAVVPAVEGSRRLSTQQAEIPRHMARRNFVAAGALAALGTVGCSKEDPLLGLIFPVERPVSEEGLAMYKTGVRFVTSNLDLKTLTPEGYDAVLDDIPAAARK
jgi:hypothetical protein